MTFNQKILNQLLQAKDYHARAAAVRVLRYTGHQVKNQLDLLKKATLPIAMEERRDELGDFLLNNEGDLFFPKVAKRFNESITKFSV